MKKAIVWALVIVFAISISLVGISCKAAAVETTAAAATTAAETAAATTAAATTAAETAASAETAINGKLMTDLKIGYVMPYLEGWFFYWDVGWKTRMRADSLYTETILTYWDPEAELQAVRDFITKGFDAITLQTASPDVAQSAAQICNEAGVPFFIENAAIAEGPGTIIADVEMDWVEIGRQFGNGIADNWPGAKIVEMQGAPGFPVVEKQIQGMEEVLAKRPGSFERLKTEYNKDYSAEVTFNGLSAIIQSGLKFDCVIGGYQEAAEASIEAMKANDISMDDVIVISGNGGPLDEANFIDGDLDAAVSEPVAFHAMLVATTIIEYLKGNGVPALQKTPSVWVMRENWKETLIPWDMDESWLPVAQKFVETGKLEY